MAWLVTLKGHTQDLENIATLFSPASSPKYHVIKDGDNYYLYHHDFDRIANASAIRSQAGNLVDTMNGLAKVRSRNFQIIQIDHVVEIQQHGKSKHYLTLCGELRFESNLGRTHFRKDGTSEETHTIQFNLSEVHNSLEIMQNNTLVAQALKLYGSLEPSWRNLYLVLEVLEDGVGGERALTAKNWCQKRKLKLFKQTANSFSALGEEARHGSTSQSAPPKPMTLAEAQEFIRQLLDDWMQDIHQSKA